MAAQPVMDRDRDGRDADQRATDPGRGDRPRRPDGSVGTSASSTAMPAVVEANEAAIPSPSRAPSSPFNRA